MKSMGWAGGISSEREFGRVEFVDGFQYTPLCFAMFISLPLRSLNRVLSGRVSFLNFSATVILRHTSKRLLYLQCKEIPSMSVKDPTGLHGTIPILLQSLASFGRPSHQIAQMFFRSWLTICSF